MTEKPSINHAQNQNHHAVGIGLGVGIFLLTRRVQHALTLPGCMVLSVAVFYTTLWGLGYTLADARALGWVAPSLPPSPFWEAWSLFNLRLVQWDVIPSILPTWFALVVVVAFSSSLDVAAIEMEIRRPLDYDHELRMIGLSNVVSGLSGGYTGSYIFSQTIFCLRSEWGGVGFGTCVCVCVCVCVTGHVVAEWLPGGLDGLAWIRLD
jgi:sulfate permease, SulP family